MMGRMTLSGEGQGFVVVVRRQRLYRKEGIALKLSRWIEIEVKGHGVGHDEDD
jgi:hypothetical protein